MKDEIKEIRDYIACPQFGDNHYGKWGTLRLDQRIKIKQLLDYITNLQEITDVYNRKYREVKMLKEQLLYEKENTKVYKSKCEKLELENKLLKEQMVAMVQPNYVYGIELQGVDKDGND